MQSRPPTSDETELIRQAKKGDSEAFGELYMLHLERIYRHILYRVESAMEAEDLTEQVFVRAWQAIKKYRPEGPPFAAWLYRIAHNLVIDHYRTRKDMAPLDSVSFTLADEALGPEEVLNKKSEVARLRKALSRLSQEQQQLVHLRFIEGLSHAQVARILDRSVGAVRVMQHRALAALNGFMGGSSYDG
jgi:RNA polymerase sigma-70 factor (ECF subfamily)